MPRCHMGQELPFSELRRSMEDNRISVESRVVGEEGQACRIRNCADDVPAGEAICIKCGPRSILQAPASNCFMGIWCFVYRDLAWYRD